MKKWFKRLDESLSYRSFKKAITGKCCNSIDLSKILIDFNNIVQASKKKKTEIK